ncbi:hypothetical protein FDUTEX481_09802 [Tolypothrix sp. PCC 7601]|nr:hypothetical protein FDUTEX481_09802 [Tolypothrix sp. PCC 7601]
MLILLLVLKILDFLSITAIIFQELARTNCVVCFTNKIITSWNIVQITLAIKKDFIVWIISNFSNR